MSKIKHNIKQILLWFFRPIYYAIQAEDIKAKTLKKTEVLKAFQSCGYGVKLNGSTHVFTKPKKIIIGNNVHIGNGAYFNSGGGIIIGNNTHISRNVTIYSTNHNYNGKTLPYDNSFVQKPVTIEANVWIGMNVSIVPGVTIGEGAIIGMGTVVNRTIKPFEIVGSPKAQPLKERNHTHYKNLAEVSAFGGVNGKALQDFEIKKFKKTYTQNKDRPLVLIVSTGRSGSQSIVDTLQQHPQCKAYHENIHQLIRLSTQWAHKEKSKSEVENELHTIFNHKLWTAKENEILIHSDQRLWNLIPFFSEYFSNLKVIHLTRNAKDAITSMVARHWYQPNEYENYNTHDWAYYRLQGDTCGAVRQMQWNSFSNIEKCTWYWGYINLQIQNALQDLPKTQCKTVNLEELSFQIESLQKFMGITPKALEIKKTNTMRKGHQNNINNTTKVQVELAIKKLLTSTYTLQEEYV